MKYLLLIPVIVFITLFFYTKHVWETEYAITLIPDREEFADDGECLYINFPMFCNYEQADVVAVEVSPGWEAYSLAVFPTTDWMEKHSAGFIGRGDVVCREPLTIRHDNKKLEYYGPSTYYKFHLCVKKIEKGARLSKETLKLRVGPPGFYKGRSPWQIISGLFK